MESALVTTNPLHPKKAKKIKGRISLQSLIGENKLQARGAASK